MMSFKVFSYIALVVLIVQVTVSDAATTKAAGASNRAAQPGKVASAPKVAATKCNCQKDANGKCKDPLACKSCPGCNPALAKKAAPAGTKAKCNCKKDANGKCKDPQACKSCPGCNPALAKKAVNPPRLVPVKA